MRIVLPFLVLLLVHHFLLAPLLRKRLPLYIGLTMALLVLFGFWCFSPIGRPQGAPAFPGQNEMMPPPPPGPGGRGPEPQGRKGPISPETSRLITGILLVGVDLGAYFYMESRRKERRMKELEAENTKQRLESLRYQINPHFLMNTLNNIHALVDLDPEKARESILELSKMMRYILYEGNRPTIPLAQEADFLRHYVSLMRIRYPGEIRIDLSLPADCGEAEVPPLVFASSVENAFKHGISYEAESFVSIEVSCEDGRVVFRCSNSRHGAATGGGIGVDNVRKRLELLYDEDFTYTVEATESRYDIRMNLPASPGNHPAAV